MKKLLLFSGLLLTTWVVDAQTNYSGAYGYTLKLKGNPGNDKEAKGPAGNLVLLKMEGNKYRFWLDVSIGWPSYNSGETDGTVTIVNDTASFDNTFENAIDPCILKFKVENESIIITSASNSFNCGFGNSVSADGEYTKLKVQPLLNNEWLKKEYHQAAAMQVVVTKAEIFQDENCQHPFIKKQFFSKGEKLPAIAETEKTIYTEQITTDGKFIYGWLKKTAVKVVDP
jgi:hypothetical protein